MAHHRKAVAAAVAVNAAIVAVELAAGWQAGSLSLAMDGVHNLSDELLVSVSGSSFFDPLVAGGIADWIIVSTVREVLVSRDELISPEKLVCGHARPD